MKWQQRKENPVDPAVIHQSSHHFCEMSFSDKKSNTHAFSLLYLLLKRIQGERRSVRACVGSECVFLVLLLSCRTASYLRTLEILRA